MVSLYQYSLLLLPAGYITKAYYKSTKFQGLLHSWLRKRREQ